MRRQSDPTVALGIAMIYVMCVLALVAAVVIL